VSNSERTNLPAAPHSKPSRQAPQWTEQSHHATVEELGSPIQLASRRTHERRVLDESIASKFFLALVSLTLLTPLIFSQHLAYRFATSEAYFFRTMVEVTFPLYVYLTLTYKRNRSFQGDPLTISLFAALAINTISALAGANIIRSMWGNLERMGGLIFQVHLLLFYLYILLLSEIRRFYLRRFLLTAIAVGGVTALYGALVKFHFLRGYDSTPRVSSTLGNPSFFASFLLPSIFVTLFVFVGTSHQRRWARIVFAVIVLMELYCVFLTQTRGAVVGLIAAGVLAVLFYVVLNGDKRKRLHGGIALIGVVVGTTLTFSLHSRFPDKSIFQRVFTLMNASTEFRLDQWRVALRAIGEHPLFGVGPENYYVVANRYTENIGNWVDKPHNYALEVLTTTGIIGFLAYSATLMCALWCISRGLRKKAISLPGFCMLLGGLIAYSTQSMFLFDTVAAAVLFSAFLALVAMAWRHESENPSAGSNRPAGRLWPLVAAAVVSSCLVMALTIYLVNVSGIRMAAALEAGDRWSLANPQMAVAEFEAAKHLPLDFDPVEVACEYSAFAEALTLENPSWRRGIELEAVVSSALDMQLQSLARVQNDPRPYEAIARLYLALAAIRKAPLDSRADAAIDKALTLAPGKQSLLYTKARVKAAHGEVGSAKVILDNLLQRFPDHLEAEIEMARLDWYSGDESTALVLAQRALDAGYLPERPLELDWIGAAYEKQNNFRAAKLVYERDAFSHRNNSYDFWRLAEVCAKLGDKQKAATIARTIAEFDPSRKQEMEDFVVALK
jgi:O-antigen ligase